METLTPHAVSPAVPHRNFEIVSNVPGGERVLSGMDAYTAAIAYVRGLVEVKGDLVEAIRFQLQNAGQGWWRRFVDLVCGWAPWRLAQYWQRHATVTRAIRFHYDRSNDFYRQFLDSQLVYSCAYWRPGDTLDEAQTAKLDHICRKLNLHSGEHFLDVGCGWGALLLRAAGEHGARSTGCTLSQLQAAHAREQIRARGLARAEVFDCDYRDLTGRFDKIASVGMFEHVGRKRLEAYFRKVHSLLAPHGLFLNHGITRPANIQSDAQSMFIARKVFPGGEIVSLGDVIRAAELAGFEVVDVEDLRRHYALTCRAWVDRLGANRDACLRCVDEETWRTWRLYLAGSALAFEEGSLALHQILLSRQGEGEALPMTRDYVYTRDGHPEPK